MEVEERMNIEKEWKCGQASGDVIDTRTVTNYALYTEIFLCSFISSVAVAGNCEING